MKEKDKNFLACCAFSGDEALPSNVCVERGVLAQAPRQPLPWLCRRAPAVRCPCCRLRPPATLSDRSAVYRWCCGSDAEVEVTGQRFEAASEKSNSCSISFLRISIFITFKKKFTYFIGFNQNPLIYIYFLFPSQNPGSKRTWIMKNAPSGGWKLSP